MKYNVPALNQENVATKQETTVLTQSNATLLQQHNAFLQECRWLASDLSKELREVWEHHAQNQSATTAISKPFKHTAPQ